MNMNWRLAAVIFAISSVVVIGSIMVAVMAAGYTEANGIVFSVVLGLILSLPATYVVTRQMIKFINSNPYH